MDWRFYCYAYFRPNEEAPFYVGKGTGDRCFDHLNYFKAGKLKYNNFFLGSLRKLAALGIEPRIILVAYFIDEISAYEFETAEIARYGRRIDGSGCLDNIDPGFRNRIGFLGKKHTEETRRLMCGRKRTDETRRLMRKPKSKDHADKIRRVAQEKNSATCTWSLLDPWKNQIEVTNLNKFCKELNMNPTPIYRSLLAKRPIQRGSSAGWQALSKTSAHTTRG